MLIVTIVQALAVGFTLTALWENELMFSPEENGVVCNITSNIISKNISADNLEVFWGWKDLQIRWNFEGYSDTQIWLRETYEKVYQYRCKRTHSPTAAPIPTPHPTHHPTRPTKPPTPSPTPSPTNTTITHSQQQRKLLSLDQYGNSHYFDDDERISFEVPPELTYDSVLDYRSFLPSIFYPLPPLQLTNTYGSDYVEYAYPFKITAVEMLNKNHNNNNDVNTTLIPEPTAAPTQSPTKGCDDLNIVIETGKSYFSLLVCGLVFAAIALIILIAPTCYLVSMKMRRLIKQIVIGLNTLSFMLLLMAFAIWFAYFSQNINSVVENGANTKFSVCILGTPEFGVSIGFLLAGWLLIGLATMMACYLGNRPKKWYRYLRDKRNYGGGSGKLMGSQSHAINAIHEEDETDSDEDLDNYKTFNDGNDDDNDGQSSSDHTDSDNESDRFGRLIHRTPSNNSSGSNDTYMTADISFGQYPSRGVKGDNYPMTYSPLG